MSSLYKITKKIFFLRELLILIVALPVMQGRGLAQPASSMVEFAFIQGIYGNVLPSSKAHLKRLTFLKEWKKEKPNRYIIDLGDNYLPGAIGNFSSGLAIAELIKEIGTDISILGKNELQLELDFLAHLQARRDTFFTLANLSSAFLKNDKFLTKGYTVLGKEPNSVAILFYYGNSIVSGIDIKKWPLSRFQMPRMQSLEEYLSTQFHKLKNFHGLKILFTVGSDDNFDSILKKFPQLHAVVEIQDLSSGQTGRESSLLQIYASGQAMVKPLSWHDGIFFLQQSISGSKNHFGMKVEYPEKNQNQKMDAKLQSILETWSRLYLNRENSVYAFLDRQIKKEEIYPFIARMLQDDYQVEWLLLPRWYIYPREVSNRLDLFLLDEMIASNEQYYRFSIRGDQLSRMKQLWPQGDSYFWQNPGDDSINPKIYYKVSLPASFYRQVRLRDDSLDEENLSMKTWKGVKESVISYSQAGNQDKPVLSVDEILAPNPMWRWNVLWSNDISFRKIEVANNEQLQRPNYVNKSTESYRLSGMVGLNIYNISHSFSLKESLAYSKSEGAIIENQSLLSFEYVNRSMQLKPYLRSQMETIIVHEPVKEFYPQRPWLYSQAVGMAIPLWIISSKLGIRMEKDFSKDIDPRYGIEFSFDFSKLFLKIFTYTLANENYISYARESNLQKIGYDMQLKNEIKIEIVRGLYLVLQHKYKVYRQQLEENVDLLTNQNSEVLLQFEKMF